MKIKQHLIHEYVKSELYLNLVVILLISISALFFHQYYYEVILFFIILSILILYVRRRRILRNKLIVVFILLFLFLFKIIFSFTIKSNKKEDFVYNKNNKEYLFKYIPSSDSSQNSGIRLIGHITDTKPKDKNFIGRRLFISTDLSTKRAENRPKEEIWGKLNSSITTDGVIIIEDIRETKFKNEKLHFLTKQRKDLEQIKGYESVGFGWAMLSGSKEFIKGDKIKDFVETGTMHLFAVSGLHVGFLYLLITLIIKIFRVNRFPAFLIKFFLSLIYLFYIGFPVSAIRAFIMITAFEVCNFINIKQKRINFFNISIICLIIYDYLIIFSISAQLSFTVVLFIIFTNYKKIKNDFSLVEKFVNYFIFSVSAAAGSSLFVLDYFGYFSFISVLTNFLITPFIFIFYTINVLFLCLFLFFDSLLILDFHIFFYSIISWIVDLTLFLSSFLPSIEGEGYEINNIYHYLLFCLLLFLLCVFIKHKFRVMIVLFYYLLFWFGCFFSVL